MAYWLDARRSWCEKGRSNAGDGSTEKWCFHVSRTKSTVDQNQIYLEQRCRTSADAGLGACVTGSCVASWKYLHSTGVAMYRLLAPAVAPRASTASARTLWAVQVAVQAQSAVRFVQESGVRSLKRVVSTCVTLHQHCTLVDQRKRVEKHMQYMLAIHTSEHSTKPQYGS